MSHDEDNSKIKDIRDAARAKIAEERKEHQPQACLEDVILDASEFVKIKVPKKGIFLHPWITEQSIILLTGWRGIGKTWFGLFALDAITKHQSFGPWRCETSAPCLFLDGEMAAQDVVERFNSIGTSGRKHPLYVYSDAYASTKGLGRANLLDEKWRNGMKDFLLKRGVKIWIVDNLASLTPGIDENSKQEWDPINQWLLDLRFAGISTILMHHEGKQGQQRGTSGREDNIDISISLQKPSTYVPEDGAKFIVHFNKHRIRTRDLPLIADTEFTVVMGENDRVSYRYGDSKKQNKIEILKMIDEGCQQKDICNSLGIDKGYVSRVKTQAIRDGWLNSKGKLTQSGFSFVCGE